MRTQPNTGLANTIRKNNLRARSKPCCNTTLLDRNGTTRLFAKGSAEKQHNGTELTEDAFRAARNHFRRTMRQAKASFFVEMVDTKKTRCMSAWQTWQTHFQHTL